MPDVDPEPQLRLHEDAARYGELAHLACDWFWEQDAELRFTWFSAGAESKLATTPQQFMGKRRWELPLHFVSAEQIAQHRAQLLAHLPMRDFEYALFTVSGILVWYSVSGNPIFAQDGRFLGYRGVGRNIDARKQAELALHERNRELAQALDQLRQTQAELIQSAKLASLGALVAGVAHELNTPVGNALMAVTTLAERQRDLDNAVASGLSRSALQSYLETAHEALDLLERNLTRTADLICGFKQVAVDQASEQRRSFGLHQLLHEIFLAMSPTLRQSPYQFLNQIESSIEMDSFPGPLGQVFMNLISNALQHAFAGRTHGQMLVRAQLQGNGWVSLRFADDGAGIAEQHLARVFDPFFTTRLGQGGSGLGLNISHNIVTGILGGRIEVRSRPGQGTEFLIELPLAAPPAKHCQLHIDTGDDYYI